MHHKLIFLVFLVLITFSLQGQTDSIAASNLELITSSSFNGFRTIDGSKPFTGIMFEYYPGTNRVEWSQTVRNGSTSYSISKQYYPSGKVRTITNYGKAGMEHGLYQEWYETGTIKIKGNYWKGAYRGKWIYYNEDGTVKEIRKHGKN
jgi:antitoxin component YwqK of YwqJK toxin-antitoxin module